VPSPLASAIGATVRAERLARGLSQSQLTRKAGLKESHLSKVERGRGSSLATLVKIARAPDTTPAVLLDKALRDHS
jgi:transcriptional regulator with XRE-family HTH domain